MHCVSLRLKVHINKVGSTTQEQKYLIITKYKGGVN